MKTIFGNCNINCEPLCKEGKYVLSKRFNWEVSWIYFCQCCAAFSLQLCTSVTCDVRLHHFFLSNNMFHLSHANSNKLRTSEVLMRWHTNSITWFYKEMLGFSFHDRKISFWTIFKMSVENLTEFHENSFTTRIISQKVSGILFHMV